MLFSEDELIEGCIRGDRHHQRRLYELFSRRMFVVCMRYAKSRLEAEDVLQEAFIKVFENIKDFRRDCPLEGWIKRIVINTALNQNRSKLYMFPAVDVEEVQDAITSNTSLSDLNFKELLEMIQQLAPRYQVIFNLYAIEGYQHNEISTMLGISEGTSKSQYARARAILRQMIEDKQQVNYERFRKE